MMQRAFLATISICSASTVGCSQTPPNGGEEEAARLRVVHASPDAPAIDVCIEGARAFEGTSFADATGYAELPANNYGVRVTPTGAGCDSAGVLDAELPLAADTDTTIVVFNFLADLEAVLLTDDNSAPAEGNAKV